MQENVYIPKLLEISGRGKVPHVTELRPATKSWACTEGVNRVTVEFSNRNSIKRIDLETELSLDEGRAVWSRDLNGNGHDDLCLIFPKTCGNWGECFHEVLLKCSDEYYVTAWGPEYCVDLQVANSSNGSLWRNLVVTNREGNSADVHTLHFKEGRYIR